MTSAQETPLKRVIHIISGDLWAGAESQLYNLACAQAKHNYQLYVILFNRGALQQKLMADGIQTTVLDETQLNAVQIFKQLKRLLRKFQPHIVHTHGYKENILGAVANQMSIRAACLRTEHGDNEFKVPLFKPHRKLQHWINRFCGNYFQDAIIAVSAPLAEILIKRFRRSKVHIIENAIDIDRIIRSTQQAQTNPYPREVIKLACIGRLIPLKRQQLLIELMPKLIARTNQTVHLYLFGDGPQRRALESQIEQLNLTKTVSILGAVDPIFPHLQQMNILIMPSDHEGLPMTLLEALALQVPVVAHAIGGIPEVLNHGEYGRLVHNHNLQGYLDAILDTLQNTETAASRAANAYQYLQKHYAIDQQLDRYNRLYATLYQPKQTT